jgi:hypothetical protein
MNLLGQYTKFRQLVDLGPLVRKQRTLAAKLGDDKGSYADQDKAVRKDIDALLVKAGLASGDGVVCNGYEVVHRTQKGRTSISEVTLTAALVALGLAADVVAKAIADSLETGDPSAWAEVNPAKHAKVRA